MFEPKNDEAMLETVPPHGEGAGEDGYWSTTTQPKVVAGGCSVSGCICDGLMGYDDLCGNCRHHKDFHY